MKQQSQKPYDLCIIGCGPGGFSGAMRALDLGLDTVIVEGGQIGGAGVMWGALASKTMWELARDFDIAAKTDRGYRAANLGVDYQAVRDSVFQAVKEKQFQMLSQIETYSPRRWEGPGSLTLKKGYGAFLSKKEVEVSYANGDKEVVRAKKFLIATGSTPREFPNIPTDGERILNSDTILSLNTFPKRLMIIGAGIIGCEYAAIFSNFNQTHVYLVDYMDRVIPYEDEDVSDFVSTHLTENGVDILHSAVLREVQKYDDHLEVVLDFEAGHSEVLEVDAVLIAIGRVPNLSGLHLENTGIKTDDRGFLMADSNGKVCENIYGAGDVTPHAALVNVAETQSRYAVKHMCDATRWPLRYENMSTVMFFKPAVAAVGLNEKGCRKRGIAYRVATYAYALLPRAIAKRDLDGFVKIIVSDDDQQMILGMRAAGNQASSTIMSIAFLMDQRKGLKDILKTVHPHPTMSEGIQECLRVLEGKSIFKPHAFPKLVQIRSWSPNES